MSSVKSIFPGGIANWTDRIDQVNRVFAVDTNTLASEMISIEKTLGINPQIEKKPPVGTTVTYTSTDARISDAMRNAQMPVVLLTRDHLDMNNVSGAVLNTYNASYDPAKSYNGTDITIPANGWWIVTSEQTWNWWNDGFSHHALTFNGLNNIVDEDLIDWEFSGNIKLTTPNQITNQGEQNFPGGFNPGGPPRWLQYGKRSRTTKVAWQGLCHKGDRFSVFSENGTSHASHRAFALELKASMIRSVSGNFVSG